MDSPFVKAWFCKNDFNEFRDRTRIIFENKDKSLGIILMLNPGSCFPIDTEGNPIKIVREEKEHLCYKDLTLKMVIKCLEDAYGENANGYVYIVNLSTLKDTKPKNLSVGNFSESIKIIEDIDRITGDSNHDVKWIWVAFGYLDSPLKDWKDEETRKEVKSLKEKILAHLRQNYPNHVIGESIKFLHPKCFQFHNRFKENRITLIKDIKEKIKAGNESKKSK